MMESVQVTSVKEQPTNRRRFQTFGLDESSSPPPQPPTTTTTTIDIPVESRTNKSITLAERICPEKMENKMKILICVLLIMPSVIYFLITVQTSNHPSSLLLKDLSEMPSTDLNITVFEEPEMTKNEKKEALKLAIKHHQLSMITIPQFSNVEEIGNEDFRQIQQFLALQ